MRGVVPARVHAARIDARTVVAGVVAARVHPVLLKEARAQQRVAAAEPTAALAHACGVARHIRHGVARIVVAEAELAPLAWVYDRATAKRSTGTVAVVAACAAPVAEAATERIGHL